MQLPLTNCTLRSWRPEDAPSLAAHANNRKVWPMLRDRMPHPYTLAAAETCIEQRSQESANLVLCIEVGGEAVGGIGLHPGDDVNRITAELGYWIAEPYWGRGIVTKAVQAIVEYGFANNPGSARVVEKAGFQFEGRLRRNVIKDGQVLDSLLYARLRDD